jgi:hypothetical protein
MKDKNCVDPKMAAYCQAVQDLEGKFHGLEYAPRDARLH